MNKFVKVCAVNLERDSSGRVVRQLPISRGISCEKDPVFYCKFKISSTSIKGGVFLIKVDGKIRHIGGVEDLSRYFYGGCNKMCSSGTLEVKEWSSECRLTKGIPEQVKMGRLVEVWFLRIDDEKQRRNIKLKLSKGLKLKWNRTW